MIRGMPHTMPLNSERNDVIVSCIDGSRLEILGLETYHISHIIENGRTEYGENFAGRHTCLGGTVIIAKKKPLMYNYPIA